MEVRWVVILEMHPNDDPEEPRDLGHRATLRIGAYPPLNPHKGTCPASNFRGTDQQKGRYDQLPMTTWELPFEGSGIRYSICRPDEVAVMVRVLAETFARHDPPAVALGLTPAEFETFLTIVSATAGDDKLTVVARDVATGAMAGAVLNEDAGRPAVVEAGAISERFGPIFDLFDEIEGQIEDAGPIEPGTTLHVFMLGVDERFAGRGIAQQLVEASLANAAILGYQTATTEATNLVSQHIFAKLGFVTRAQASYGRYRRDGHATFSSIAHQGGVMSMIRELPDVA
jgi:ribosomal protein S18 acetylase RimI-like enzyme